jgi:MFS family permease
MTPARPGPAPARSVTGLVALIGATAVSTGGTAMTAVAVPWFVLATTGRAVDTGAVAAAEFAGLAASSVLGAPAVDRWGARRAAIAADTVSGTAVLAIPVLSATLGLPLLALIGLAGLAGLARGPAETAHYALLPEIAAAAGTGVFRATSWYDGWSRAARLVAYPLAGLLITVTGAADVLVIDAMTFAVSAALLARAVPTPTGPAVHRDPTDHEDQAGYFGQLRTGFSALRADRLVLALVGMVAVTNALDAAWVSVLVPVFARDVLHSSIGLGVLIAAFGAGSAAGAVAYGWLAPRLPGRATFIACLIAAGAPKVAVLLLPPVPAVQATLLVVLGLANGALSPLVMGTILNRTPPRLRARALGAVQAGALAPVPLGTLLAGVSVQLAG